MAFPVTRSQSAPPAVTEETPLSRALSALNSLQITPLEDVQPLLPIQDIMQAALTAQPPILANWSPSHSVAVPAASALPSPEASLLPPALESADWSPYSYSLAAAAPSQPQEPLRPANNSKPFSASERAELLKLRKFLRPWRVVSDELSPYSDGPQSSRSNSPWDSWD